MPHNEALMIVGMALAGVGSVAAFAGVDVRGGVGAFRSKVAFGAGAIAIVIGSVIFMAGIVMTAVQ